MEARDFTQPLPAAEEALLLDLWVKSDGHNRLRLDERRRLLWTYRAAVLGEARKACEEIRDQPRNVGEDARSGWDAYKIAAIHCVLALRRMED